MKIKKTAYAICQEQNIQKTETYLENCGYIVLRDVGLTVLQWRFFEFQCFYTCVLDDGTCNIRKLYENSSNVSFISDFICLFLKFTLLFWPDGAYFVHKNDIVRIFILLTSCFLPFQREFSDVNPMMALIDAILLPLQS